VAVKVQPDPAVEQGTRSADTHGSSAQPRIPKRPVEVQAAVVRPAVQSEAITRYLTLVRRGALDTSTLAEEKETGAAALADLVIAPLSVDALEMTDVGIRNGPAVDRRGPDSR
jgi:hypothetical protein